MKRFLALLITAVFCLPLVAVGQGLFAVARLDPERSAITDRSGGFDLTLGLSQPVPYKVTTLDQPPRLVLDFREVDFSALQSGDLGTSPAVLAVRHGAIQAGWSRMVVDLAGPYAVEAAGMETGADDGSARIVVTLRETDPTSFAVRAGPEPSPAPSPAPIQPDDGRLTVVIDPGHGGIDPGAVRDDVYEADLVLQFALELREALLRAGGFEVALTRTGDTFVSLESRIDIARQAGGEVILSLHADAVSEGIARGAQIYTLAEEASSAASAMLAERHDRADLLAGVDLSGQGDEVARVLMSIARTETAPRTEALAAALLESFRTAGVRLHKRPHEQAAFSVLKAPDIPSVLIELGFMSSPQELEKLQDPEWRGRAQAAIVDALGRWDAEDRAREKLRRK
ncbi:N-acetylmuramoyl-L-alanine amidase [Tropicimonas sp. IMCC6043]|uniref:N-acetylmuramoyl-L-alanine amidase n=1 Tax=Tropicimonas sp. IMCC6043 TaxID=2510645 RepID=UPI00101C476C|nr:N-acetylmuramoyl-L-alanine amidase [Tropicimonas sp. IMCC6043]RYH06960.1 N-acetylmuramoyl-L-alanine amidase [Tropicimonas sp. IMCC6043]